VFEVFMGLWGVGWGQSFRGLVEANEKMNDGDCMDINET
jgi:hypothetical protein